MSWGTVLKLLVLAIGLRVVWGWAQDKADDPPMEVWSGTPAVPTAVPDWLPPLERYRVGADRRSCASASPGGGRFPTTGPTRQRSSLPGTRQ